MRCLVAPLFLGTWLVASLSVAHPAVRVSSSLHACVEAQPSGLPTCR